jgi:hypothetical protein
MRCVKDDPDEGGAMPRGRRFCPYEAAYARNAEFITIDDTSLHLAAPLHRATDGLPVKVLDENGTRVTLAALRRLDPELALHLRVVEMDPSVASVEAIEADTVEDGQP